MSTPATAAPRTDAGPVGPSVADPAPDGPLRTDRWSQLLLVALAVPFLVGAVAARTTTWWPASDLALLDLRIADVGTADTPLLGPFSRFGWSHPGPLLYWLLAPLYRLLGATPSAGLAAAALQNAVVVVAVGVLARRIGGRRFLALFAAATAILLASLGGEVLVSTWNPWISLLPFAGFVLLAWGVGAGDVVLVPWAVLAGSYLVQSHVGYGVLVGALAVVAAAQLVVGELGRRQTLGDAWPARRRRLARLAGASVAVGAVAWIGPLVDQVSEDPGNVRAIAAYFASSDEEPVGLGEGISVASRQLSPVAPWLGGSEHLDFLANVGDTSPVLALPVLSAFAVTAVVAWRRADVLALRLHATVAVGLVSGVAAVSRITDQPYYYLFRWWWVLAMFTWLCIAFTALRALPARLDARVWRVLVPACSVITVLAAGIASTSTADPIETTTHEAAVEEVTPLVLGAVDGEGTYVVRALGFSWFEVYFGLIAQLERNGVDVLVDEQFRAHAGAGRVLDPDPDPPPDGVLFVATGTSVADGLADPRLELVAEYDPLAPDERDELERLQAEQRERLRAAGRTDLLDAVENEGIEVLAAGEPALDGPSSERIAELLRRGQRAAVFAAPWPPPDLTVPPAPADVADAVPSPGG